MAIINDLTDKLARLPIAYGRHAVKGKLTKHVVTIVGTEKQITIQRALGKGPWDSREKVYYAGEEILPANSIFHPGLANDAPDAYFPTDVAHPSAAYEASRLPLGMGDDDNPDNMIGIYKTLQVANYDEDGVQTAFGYTASPARHILDLMLRANRSIARVNYPVWVAWRDYCAQLITWDDGALTPHYISLSASAGGTLVPGTYWVRVATLKGADISSASKDRSVTDPTVTASVVIGGANLRFSVTWASQAERGATGYRIYIGTAEGAEDRYFTVANGATSTLLVTTLAGATLGAPPNVATGTLLRQIPRFESHVFFVPPFELSAALDKIAQITCMDWQYANGQLVFLTPEVRASVFTLNAAEITNFKTFQTDRRQRPNQIIVNYRNLDSPYLEPADPPVTINRLTLQAAEGVRPFEINGGCMYRSQAERVGEYWARRLIDSAQMFEGLASPKTYIVLPGDRVLVNRPDFNLNNVPFYIEEKEEAEDTKAGYELKGRIAGAWYSDTDHNPLPSPLKVANPSVYGEPAVVSSLVLTERAILGAAYTIIRGAVQFVKFTGQQRGRIWWRNPANELPFTVNTATDVCTAAAHGLEEEAPVGVQNVGGALPAPLSNASTYFILNATADTFQLSATPGGAAINLTTAGTGTNSIAEFKLQGNEVTPHPVTQQASFELPTTDLGLHRIKVVTESILGVSKSFESHPQATLNVVGPSIGAIVGPSISFDGTSLVHLMPPPVGFNEIQISKVNNAATFTDPANLIWRGSSTKWADSQLTTDPRAGTRYFRAVPIFGNPGPITSASYNVTAPLMPKISIFQDGPGYTIFNITSPETANKYQTFQKTTLESSSDINFGSILSKAIQPPPRASNTVQIRVAKPTGTSKVYLRARFSDAFGDGAYGLFSIAAPTNVALTGVGAVASASSILSASFPARAANNGERKGATRWTSVANLTQVETATAAGTITGSGTVKATITAAGLTGSPLQINVNVLVGDTAAIWAGKVRAALAANAAVAALATVSGTGTAIILTKKQAAANDATLNIALANNTSTGVVAAPTSANTRAGVAMSEWLQITFNGNKQISEIDVVTLQDNLSAFIDPTLTTTFTKYGLVDFQVQYWNGAAWVTVTGGNVVGNNKVWRQFKFVGVTTNKIRVLTTKVVDNYARIVELEAWGIPA